MAARVECWHARACVPALPSANEARLHHRAFGGASWDARALLRTLQARRTGSGDITAPNARREAGTPGVKRPALL